MARRCPYRCDENYPPGTYYIPRSGEAEGVLMVCDCPPLLLYWWRQFWGFIDEVRWRAQSRGD